MKKLVGLKDDDLDPFVWVTCADFRPDAIAFGSKSYGLKHIKRLQKWLPKAIKYLEQQHEKENNSRNASGRDRLSC